MLLIASLSDTSWYYVIQFLQEICTICVSFECDIVLIPCALYIHLGYNRLCLQDGASYIEALVECMNEQMNK